MPIDTPSPSIAPTTWPGRREVAEKYAISVATVRRRESAGILNGVADATGIIRFDPVTLREQPDDAPTATPDEDDKPDTPSVDAERATAGAPSAYGRLTARACRLFGDGASVTATAIELEQPLRVVATLHEEWCEHERGFMVTAETRTQIEMAYAKHFREPQEVGDAERLVTLLTWLMPLAGKLRAAEAQVRSLTTEAAALRDRVEALEAQVDPVEAENQELREQLATARAAQERATSQAAESRAKWCDAQAIAREMEDERDALQARVIELEDRERDLERDAADGEQIDD